MSETKRPSETEVKPKVETMPQEQPKAAPKTDVKFQQSMAEMWGDARRNWDPENPDQKTELDAFLAEQQDKFRQLWSERKVAQIHQFNDLEEYADGLPMLVDLMGRAKQGEREGYDHYPEDMRKQIEATDRRNKQLFLDTARKLFPEVKPLETFADANSELEKISNITESSQEIYHAKSALELFKDPSVSLKRRAELLDETIEMIGNVQDGNRNYGQIDSHDMPFGVSNKKQAIEAARLVYRLSLIRDQYQKELYGRKDVAAPDAKKIDVIRDQVKTGGSGATTETSPKRSVGMTEEEIRVARERSAKMNISSGRKKDAPFPKEKPVPLEESGDLAEATLGGKRFDLGKSGPMAELYSDKADTVADIKRIVKPEIKRMLLEKMLQDVDLSIQQASRVLASAEPGSILGRKGVAHFCGIGVTGGEAAVYHKIAIATEGRVVDPAEIARMPMAEYLKKYLGYDLTKDKKRAEMLQKYTNALL